MGGKKKKKVILKFSSTYTKKFLNIKNDFENSTQTFKYSRRAILSYMIIFGTLTINKLPTMADELNTNIEKEYQSDTSQIIQTTKDFLSSESKNTKEEKSTLLKTAINKWVAKYRREPQFSGRPSYSNMYSAVNALSGHFNNLGTSAPIPKKRLERILQEFEQCLTLLSRGR